MAGVKVLTEEVEKDVTLLSDVDPEFVSLVRHGANRMPFRVVKTEEKGGEEMGLFIQSVMVPRGVRLDSLTDKPEFGFLSEVKTEKSEDFSAYTKYTHMGVEKFVPESFRLVKVGDAAWVVAGELVDKADGSAVTISESALKAAPSVLTTPLDTVLGDAEAAKEAALAVSFRELMDRELGSMLDVVFGTLKQSASDPKKRKKSVLEAVDAFRNFLSVGLDAIGSAATKSERSKWSDLAAKGGHDMSELFKDREEFTTAVAGIVSDVLKKKEEEAKALAEEAAKAEAEEAKVRKLQEAKKTITEVEKGEKEAAFESAMSKITEAVSDLKTTVTDLAKKQEELGAQLGTEPSEKEDEETPAKKTEKSESEKKASIFAGLLTGAA